MPHDPLPKVKAIAILLILGAIAALIASLVDSEVLRLLSPGILLNVLIAPVVEELCKVIVMAIPSHRNPLNGMAVGLGFGLLEAILVSPAFQINRLVGSIPLHTSAGGIEGHALHSKRYWLIIGAILLHISFNALNLVDGTTSFQILIAICPAVIFLYLNFRAKQ